MDGWGYSDNFRFKSQKSQRLKFYISTTFGLSFMIRSVAPTRSSTFYAYLITKIGNRNLKTDIQRSKNVKRLSQTEEVNDEP